jgi:dTDP-4-dehydrorhamnose reductase
MYTESDSADAQDLYGRSKLLGETAAPNTLTLRTSIIGHELGSPTGLVDWFLSQQGRQVQGYKWAFFSGLTTLALSQVIGDVIEHHQDLAGLWHVAAERIDKDTLLNLIKKRYDADVDILPQDDKPMLDRSLDASRFNQATGHRPMSWPGMIDQMYQDPSRVR